MELLVPTASEHFDRFIFSFREEPKNIETVILDASTLLSQLGVTGKFSVFSRDGSWELVFTLGAASTIALGWMCKPIFTKIGENFRDSLFDNSVKKLDQVEIVKSENIAVENAASLGEVEQQLGASHSSQQKILDYFRKYPEVDSIRSFNHSVEGPVEMLQIKRTPAAEKNGTDLMNTPNFSISIERHSFENSDVCSTYGEKTSKD